MTNHRQTPFLIAVIALAPMGCADVAGDEPIPIVDGKGDSQSAGWLNPALVGYSQRLWETGIPACLAVGGSDVAGIVHSFGEPDSGVGTHLGAGYVLTARHVARPMLPEQATTSPDGFIGDLPLPFPASWSVRGMPARGSYLSDTRPSFLLERDLGTWNDYALLHTGTMVNAPTFGGMAATGPVAPGEHLWVVGDMTAGRLRVTVGDRGELKGNNALLENIDIEPGFSGGPIIEASCRVVGVVVVKLVQGRRAVFVTSEAVDTLLEAVRGSFADVPDAVPGGQPVPPPPSSCTTLPLGDLEYCTPGCPCAEGEGDCDQDEDCEAGLACFQNIGADWGFNSTLDVCERPA